MGQSWSESGITAGGFEVTFEGINQDEKDLLDEENFKRGLRAPERPDPNDAVIYERGARTLGLEEGRYGGDPRGWSTRSIVYGAVIFLGTGVAMATLPDLLGFLAVPVAILLIFFGPRFFPDGPSPIRRNVRGPFALRITAARVTCSGLQCDVSFDSRVIGRFVGDRRLSLRLIDGQTVHLPPVLESRDHALLAERCNELLREAKSLSADYRGSR